MVKCQVCGVNDLIDEDEINTGMCRDCMASLMNAGVYCD